MFGFLEKLVAPIIVKIINGILPDVLEKLRVELMEELNGWFDKDEKKDANEPEKPDDSEESAE